MPGLGTFSEASRGESQKDAVLRYEDLVGVEAWSTRHYVGLDQPLDGGTMTWSASVGKIQIISLHARINNYDALRWSAIARGDHDAMLRQRVQELMSYAGFAYVVWHHEPENDTDAIWQPGGPDQDGPSGTAQDYIDAGLHVRDVMRKAGLTASRALFGQCLMAGTYGQGHGGYDAWKLPFAVLLVDGYDKAPAAPVSKRHSFSSLFAPAHNVATQTGRHLIVEECGTCESDVDANYKSRWFNEASNVSWPELLGASYSNVTAKADFRVNSSPQALNAYKAWATKWHH